MHEASLRCHACGTVRRQRLVTDQEIDDGLADDLCPGCGNNTVHDVFDVKRNLEE